MSDQSRMFYQVMLWGSPNVIFSPALGSGLTRFAAPDGATTEGSGQDHVLVHLSHRQARAQGLTTSGTYGQRGSGSFLNVDLMLSMVNKLAAFSEKLGSDLFRLTWVELVIPGITKSFRLAASARRTSGAGCSSWPTPVAEPSNGSAESYLVRKGRREDGAITDLGAAAQLASWPTP